MRISRTTTTVLAACCSLALAAAGPALAADPEPERPAAVTSAPAPGTADRLTTVGSLGDTLSLGARIAKDAQTAKPDMTKLREMQRQLTEQAAALRASVKAHTQQAQQPAKQSRPGTVPRRDVADDITATLDKLVQDVAKLLEDLLTANLTAVPGDAQAVLDDLTKLVNLVTSLLGGTS
ncbi:hypothetical protein [Streptomyces huiliensis]|uniref:hypothetical protein n=1 Tax=Streptomyces huiliensis TaxID=2876027 RepID=UPI001CBFBC1F|nr:hypothetical protein [Streptomyces huiliensis]MBZ4319596.1 hypothetical protein [Streptomyces huiliensis]